MATGAVSGLTLSTHAARALIAASRRNELLFESRAPRGEKSLRKVRESEAASPARGTRVLPRYGAFAATCERSILSITDR